VETEAAARQRTGPTATLPKVASTSAASAAMVTPGATGLSAQAASSNRIPRAMDMPLADLARDYENLAAKAQAGDAGAAYRLFAATASCKDMATSPGDLAGRLQEIRRNAESDADRAAQERFARGQYDRCAPLGNERRKAWRDWLALSARLGNADAQLRYARAGAPTNRDSDHYWSELESYRNTASGYLEDQIARGNVDALITAASVYDGNSNDNLFKPDVIAHFAYLYAHALATGEDSGVFFDKLAVGQESLSEKQRANVQALGETIYGKCCKR
jgi:hypothetical protein